MNKSFFARAVAAASIVGAVVACSSSTEPSDGGTTDSDSGTVTQSCSQASACTNGTCKCVDGPKKDTTCCGADSPSGCALGACAEVCKFCK